MFRNHKIGIFAFSILIAFPIFSYAETAYGDLTYGGQISVSTDRNFAYFGDSGGKIKPCKIDGEVVDHCAIFLDFEIWLPTKIKKGSDIDLNGNKLRFLGCRRSFIFGETKEYCLVERKSSEYTGPIMYYYTPSHELIAFLYMYDNEVTLFLLQTEDGWVIE